MIFVTRICPTGFKLMKLQEKHCELIAPYWMGIDDLQARQAFFKVLIKRFHSIGLFTEENPNTPIAWCLQYPAGRPGHLYVTEPYRRRGFATLIMKHMCRCMLEDGLIPQVAVREQIPKDMMEKIGFVEVDKYYILKKV
jgi:predicted GNAT family acetyltransferase